jgi:hypothetical protein
MKNRTLARTIEDLRRRVLSLQQRAGRGAPARGRKPSAAGVRPEAFDSVVAALD